MEGTRILTEAERDWKRFIQLCDSVMPKIRVVDAAWRNTEDINLDDTLNAPELDGHIKKCAAAVTEALKTPAPGYSKEQAIHMSWMFDAMRFTHSTIRNLVAKGTNSPECVDALALCHEIYLSREG